MVTITPIEDDDTNTPETKTAKNRATKPVTLKPVDEVDEFAEGDSDGEILSHGKHFRRCLLTPV